MRVSPLFPVIVVVSTFMLAATPPAHAGKSLRAAPSFRFATSRGSATLDSLRGKVVLVDFWASWCAPCERSFPWMSALRDSFAPRGLEIVAINLDKDRAAAEKFLARHPVGFTIVFDPDGKIAEAYQVTAMPTSFVVDPQGQIVTSHRGFDPKTAGALEAVIRKECSP